MTSKRDHEIYSEGTASTVCDDMGLQDDEQSSASMETCGADEDLKQEVEDLLRLPLVAGASGVVHPSPMHRFVPLWPNVVW